MNSHNFKISQKYSSNSYDERTKEVKFLILHHTQRDFQTSLSLLQDKVSVHYLISESPVEIFQLVADDKRAWHAGQSYWKGEDDINSSAIGIEIVNLDGNKNSYPDQQIEAVIFLCKKIIAKYNIAPNYILGHSDIAPLRKDDPGSLFPWKKLYQNGIGVMPNKVEISNLMQNIQIPTALELQKNLTQYGYQINQNNKFDIQTQTVLDSFRRHFCPQFIGKEIDKTTYITLLSLIKKYTFK